MLRTVTKPKSKAKRTLDYTSLLLLLNYLEVHVSLFIRTAGDPDVNNIFCLAKHMH